MPRVTAAWRARSTGRSWCTTASAHVADRQPARRDPADRARAARPAARADRTARGRGRRGAGVLPGLPLLPAHWAARTSTRQSRVPASHRPDLADVLDVLAPVLADPDQPAALRFQQTSGMVMAKGVEDCAFYRSSRLTSLNEVGADPSIFAITPEEWHDAMVVRQRDWPHAMTTLTTHDTKRGEDVRARIAVLAEIPDVWEESLDWLLSLAPVPDPGFAIPAVAGDSSVSGRHQRRTTCASDCTRTPRRRCARPVTTPRGPTRTRTTRTPCTPRSTRRSTTRMCARCSTSWSARSRRPGGATASR